MSIVVHHQKMNRVRPLTAGRYAVQVVVDQHSGICGLNLWLFVDLWQRGRVIQTLITRGEIVELKVCLKYSAGHVTSTISSQGCGAPGRHVQRVQQVPAFYVHVFGPLVSC